MAVTDHAPAATAAHLDRAAMLLRDAAAALEQAWVCSPPGERHAIGVLAQMAREQGVEADLIREALTDTGVAS